MFQDSLQKVGTRQAAIASWLSCSYQEPERWSFAWTAKTFNGFSRKIWIREYANAPVKPAIRRDYSYSWLIRDEN